MFLVECGQCHARRLVGVQRIRALRNLTRGVIAVELTCYCGEAAIVLTGRAAAPTSDPTPG